MAAAGKAPGNERRTNQPVREQAQKWFEALRAHLTATGAQTDIVERLKAWPAIEDLLADCPQLVPALLKMAWQLRREAAFAGLFETAPGQITDDTTAKLIPCGKSFDEVVLAQLHGATRLYCQRQEAAWLAAEKARYEPGALEKISFLAPLMRRLKKRRDQDVIKSYPQRGLYLALKPFLRTHNQFGLIEALASLPTATVGALGSAVRGLDHDAAIRNLAALEGRKCKFMAELARTFAETVIESPDAAALPITPPAVKENLAEITGRALSHLTRDGLHLVKGAIAVRESAKQLVTKMAAALGYGVWMLFATKEGALNALLCPPQLARALGEDAARVPRRTSEALLSIPDQRVIDDLIGALLKTATPAQLIEWAATPMCAPVWASIASDFKQALAAKQVITPESLAPYCAQLAPRFQAACAPQAAAPEPAGAPAA